MDTDEKENKKDSKIVDTHLMCANYVSALIGEEKTDPRSIIRVREIRTAQSSGSSGIAAASERE